jgi:hypothetical protein
MLERLYRVSATGVIVLVLTKIGYEKVDEALDDIVARMPHDIPGVRYVEGGDKRAVRRACRTAPIIFWTTRSFKAEAESSAGAERIFPIAEMVVSAGWLRAMPAKPDRHPGECELRRKPPDAGAQATAALFNAQETNS